MSLLKRHQVTQACFAIKYVRFVWMYACVRPEPMHKCPYLCLSVYLFSDVVVAAPAAPAVVLFMLNNADDIQPQHLSFFFVSLYTAHA